MTESEDHEATRSTPAGVPRRKLLTMAAGAAAGGIAVLAARPAAAQAGSLAIATTNRPDVVGDWFDVVESSFPMPPTPFVDDRGRAMCWMAALTALGGGPGRSTSSSHRRAGFDDAAVVTAVHDVLVALMPAQAARLDGARDRSLAAIADSDGKQDGIRAGQAAAAATWRDRRGDGFDVASLNRPYTPPPPAPGVYRLPPEFTATQGAGLGLARPFLLGRGDRFRPPPPPGLDSDVYRQGLDELRTYGVRGEGSLRSARQRDIAWLAPGMQYTPALRAVLAMPGRTVQWKVRLLAAYTAITVDAQIAVGDGKFAHLHWRPVTAIREGDARNSPEPDWLSYLPTPPNPEYPSGHGAGAGAAEKVLEHFVGRRTPVPFTAHCVRGDDGGAVTLDYPRGTRWSSLTQDNVDARVWAGVHWRSSDEAGATLGRRVADYDLRRLG
jgi:vanadium-dependent haloperoxidase-like protein